MSNVAMDEGYDSDREDNNPYAPGSYPYESWARGHDARWWRRDLNDRIKSAIFENLQKFQGEGMTAMLSAAANQVIRATLRAVECETGSFNSIYPEYPEFDIEFDHSVATIVPKNAAAREILTGLVDNPEQE